MNLADEMDAALEDEDGLVDMVNLNPEGTGLDFWVHVFQNLEDRSPHAPWIKVFQGPGPPHGPIAITIPVKSGDEPCVVAGEVTITADELESVITFVRAKREALLRYWTDPVYGCTDLLIDLSPEPRGERGSP